MLSCDNSGFHLYWSDFRTKITYSKNMQFLYEGIWTDILNFLLGFEIYTTHPYCKILFVYNFDNYIISQKGLGILLLIFDNFLSEPVYSYQSGKIVGMRFQVETS